MTTFSDETLMAFADGELDPTTRAAVTEAMRENPEIERQIARHRALRARVRLAYSAGLEQPIPERLLAAARGHGTARKPKVVELAAARAVGGVRNMSSRPRWQSPAAMAASLLIGVAVGYFVSHRSEPLIARAGGWVAGGALADALSNRLGGDSPAGSAVRVGFSFVAKSGEYCRMFTLSASGSPAGVACRRQDGWQIRAMAQDGSAQSRGTPAGATGDAYRMAESPLSPVLLGAIQDQIAGEPLDREGEIDARRQGWRSTGEQASRPR